MKIQVLAFASARDALGGGERDIELPAHSTIADLKRYLSQEFPGFDPLWPRLAVAIDGALAQDEATLTDGAEVALLPPVSGGAPASGGNPEPLASLTEAPLDTAKVAASVQSTQRGAVVTFLGTVRDHHQGRDVLGIEYTAYRPMAVAKLQKIVEELESEGKDLRIAITHRLGDLQPGECSVVIAAASPHREAAYQASRLALERLKAEVPIWKRERYLGGETVWREEEPLAASTA